MTTTLAISDDDRNQLAAMTAAQRSHWLALTFDLPEALPAVPEPDEDEDPDDGPLSDPQTMAGYQAWRAGGIRTFNLHEAEAIAAATEQPLGFGVFCSAFAWRLNGGGGWWTKTAPEWAADLGISVEQFRRVQTVMHRLRLVRRKVGRCNVTTYQLDHEAITALTHGYGDAMGVDFKGLAARFEGNPKTVEQTREKFHGLRESRKWFEGNPQTRIQGKELQNPPAHPVDTATQHDGPSNPGEDEDKATSKPPAPAKPPADTEAAAHALIRCCGQMGINADPAAVRNFCTVRNVTPAEATHAVGIAQNSPNPIDSFNYFKAVIDNARKEGQKRGETPIGSVPMARNVALEEINRINGEAKQVTAVGEQSLAAALAAARQARDKARF
jgi:hypothetical protein